MTDLTDCYFCGSIEAPLESHQVIPSEAEPPEERQLTVTLCPTCRTKLERVTQAIVDQLDAGSAVKPETKPSRSSDKEDDPSSERPETDTPAEEQHGGSRQDTNEPSDAEADSRNASPAEGDDRPSRADLPEAATDLLRLLRNREFPVERGEIVAVAANAYERQIEECDDAIDSLIGQGWLREEDGQLFRPE